VFVKRGKSKNYDQSIAPWLLGAVVKGCQLRMLVDTTKTRSVKPFLLNGLGYFSQFGCRTPKSGAPQRDNHLNRPHHDHGRIPTSAQYYRPPAHHLMQNNVYIHVIFLYCLYCDIYRRSLLIPRHTFSCSSRLMAMFDYGRTRQQMKAGCRRQLFEHIGFEIPAICL
jgi:hypothetical protein